ncbi:putative nucleolar transcription factor 1-A isoform X4 [Apostichopus japonicus]|uniref:Putative nucleolar transcription factor 1-A isoform X4 n=1 Tax=Stichopus japonicus TaxID=307972 RepID=A0A2G8K4K1_STIJA|nr:putative nucleolar transcription factor 1-A isoform X4 [Apostichopus japonicus]
MDDRVTLVSNLKLQLPKRDTRSYKSTISKVNWEKVAFKQFSPKECQQEWELIQADIRKYKNATEIVTEALDMVNNTTYLPKLSALYPNMPKKPLTPFFQYYSAKHKSVKEKNPSFSQTKISQVLSEKYKTLPEKKKQKYVTKYAAEMKDYDVKKTEFYTEHPELKQSKKGEGSRSPICPTPYRWWLAKQLMDRPEVPRSEVESELRAKWKALSDKRRLKWIHMSLQKKDEYEQAIQEYSKTHPNFKPNSKPLLTKSEKALYDKAARQAHQTTNAKKEYFENLEKYVLTLPPEEAAKYQSELAASKVPSKSRKKASTAVPTASKSIFSGLDVYLNEFKEKFEKKNPNLKPKAIEKMLKEKYQALPKTKMNKYEERAKEMNALSSGSEADSSSDEDDDSEDEDDNEEEEEEEEEEDDVMARNLWIEHNLHSYMQVHKLKEARAKKSLRLAWENLEKARKVPWKNKRNRSAYGIFTSEMMRNQDIVKLDQKNKMKAVAEKWKNISKTEKRKYEAKKDRLWKKHEKDVEKYKKSLSSTDQELLEKVLTNPIPKTKQKVAKASTDTKDGESSEDSDSEESEEEEEDDEGSSGDDESDEDGEKGTEESAEEEATVQEKPIKQEQSSDDGATSSSESSSDSDSDDDN